MHRREQLFMLWAIAATIVTVALGVVLVIFALPHFPARVVVGKVDQFASDSPTYITLPLEVPDPRGFGTISRIWIVRDAQGDFTALIGRNPLRVEPVLWEPVTNRFEAPITGAKWDRQGKYLLTRSDLGADLDRYPVAVENGQVVVEFRVIPSVPLP